MRKDSKDGYIKTGDNFALQYLPVRKAFMQTVCLSTVILQVTSPD